MDNIDKLVDDILYKHNIEDVKKKFKKRNAIVVPTMYGNLFVDQEDGQCYLFDKDGNLDDINKVKTIEYNAFCKCKALKNIKIPCSVESIGVCAFYNCKSLTRIKIPSSVETIEYRAFKNCTSLKEVVFKGKTMKQVKTMVYYPWGIKDKSIIKCLS